MDRFTVSRTYAVAKHYAARRNFTAETTAMITMLVMIIIVLIVLALVIYMINYIPGLEQPFKNIIIVLCILIAILIILVKSGLLTGV